MWTGEQTVTAADVHIASNRADSGQVGTTADDCLSDERLHAALDRYQQAYRSARPSGSAAEITLVRARLDLTLMLLALDEPLPDALIAQLPVDAVALVRNTPPLDLTTD